MTLQELYTEMKNCQLCVLRQSCTQVVTHEGQVNGPTLMIIGESPGADEDESGRPFIGRAGQLLRQTLRSTGKINAGNTLITNTVHCRPPGNKFPTDGAASTCVSKWVSREIEIAQPKLILILGSQALKYIAGMKGITSVRGQWITARGIRTMPTLHPSYVLREENAGNTESLDNFTKDIFEVANEVAELDGSKTNA